MQEVQVWSLVKKLRFCMWCGVAKKNKNKNKKIWNRRKIKELNSVAEEYNKWNEKYNREQSLDQAGEISVTLNQVISNHPTTGKKDWRKPIEVNYGMLSRKIIFTLWKYHKKWQRNSSESGHPCFVPEETIIEKDTCIPMFIAAQFTIARTWKQT